MALVNDTIAAGNAFGYAHKGTAIDADNLKDLWTECFSIKATAAKRLVYTNTKHGFTVKNFGCKAVKADLVVNASESTAPVFTIYLESVAGTQTSKGTITLAAGTTVEHEDPPCYDDSFAAFYVAAGEQLIIEHTTAGTHGSTSGTCALVAQIELDPTSLHALD